MIELDIHRFHPTEKTRVVQMTIDQWKLFKGQKDYIYRAYQKDFNPTIIK